MKTYKYTTTEILIHIFGASEYPEQRRREERHLADMGRKGWILVSSERVPNPMDEYRKYYWKRPI